MLVDPKDALRSAARFFQRNPDVLKRVAKDVREYKLTIPLDALRYVAEKASTKKNAPKDMVIEAQSPSLRVAGTVSLMGTSLRFGATVRVQDVEVSEEKMRFEIRLKDVKLNVEGDGASPVAALIKSGALDLSKPGNLVRYMPNRPPSLIEAEDDRIVLDLLKDEKITKNPKFQRVLDLLVPVLGVRAIGTESDALVISFLPKREGWPKVSAKLREALAGLMH